MRVTTALLSLLFPLSAMANVLGDMQTFSPNTDGLDFISVHSARPLPQGYFVFSNYLNFAKDHLLVYKTLGAQDRIDYEDSLFEYDFGVAYGFSENLQLSLQMPVLLSHSTKEQDGVRVNLTEGIHSFRPGFKWTSAAGKDTHWALLGSVDFPFLENSPYTGTDSLPIFNLEGAYSWSKATRIQSINVGARVRNPTDTPADAHMFPLKSQLTVSYGISDKFSSTARWVFEAFSSYPLDKEPYKDAVDASSLDLLLGLKHRWYKNLNFDWGATVEPGVKTLAPAYRVFAGLVYYWKPGSNSTPSGEKTVEKAFVIVPDDKTINTFEWVQYYAEGDVQIESCQVIEGPGSLNSACEFTSDQPGFSRLEFRDSFGRTVTRMVTIRETTVRSPLRFTQKSYEVYTGSSLQVEAEGGESPYRFGIVRGQGTGQGTMEETGFYEAPLRKQTVYIQVTDHQGRTAKSTIKVIEPPKEDKAIDLSNLEFVSGKAQLTDASLAQLRKNLENLRQVQIKKLIVEGHTDSVGSDEYNQRLSRKRAETVKDILSKELGLDRKNIEAIGYGESRPVASNDNATGRQRNRRVVLKVYYNK